MRLRICGNEIPESLCGQEITLNIQFSNVIDCTFPEFASKKLDIFIATDLKVWYRDLSDINNSKR